MVAGFVCTDGIVLCADSQETIDDYLKVDVPKAEIRPEGKAKRKGLYAVFVGSGHGPLIDALIEEMWDAAESARGGLKNVSDAMKAANRKYHKELKEVFRDRDPEYPRAELIYAVNVGDELALFKAFGPVTNRIRTYELAGAGRIVGKYIGERAGARRRTINQAVVLSLHILNQTSEHVEGVGGHGQQVIILRPGKQPESLDHYKQAAASSQLFFLDRQTMQLLLDAADLELSDEEFEIRVRHLLTGLRHSRQQQNQFRETLLASLKKMREELDEIERKNSTPSASQKSEPEP